MSDRTSDDPLVQLPEETARALTASSEPVVELRYAVEPEGDEIIHDGVGGMEIYEVGDGYVVGDFAPSWSNWYAGSERTLHELLDELTSESWTVESCSLDPEPAWLSRYE